MNPKLKLSKLDCARRQLEMGIELYFMERDPVSIHTLAGAVYQLLVDLNKHQGGKPMTQEMESLKEVIIPGKEEEAYRLFRKAENFFKHADRDPNEVIDFSPEINGMILWESSLKYVELTGEQTPAMQAIHVWWIGQHPDLFKYADAERNRAKEMARTFLKSVSKGQFYKEFINHALLRGKN
jgi:hypothetical protein